MTKSTILVLAAIAAGALSAAAQAPAADERREYRVLATNKTSTMQKEMNEAAAAGFQFDGVMGGNTSFGGSEAVVIMSKAASAPAKARREYKLLATSKTSTMQKEMTEAGAAGFDYRGQTVFKSTFGGNEVVVIVERDTEAEPVRYLFKLLATSKTSTMQREISQTAEEGFIYTGMTVGQTAMGGTEVVTIMRRTTRR